MTKERIEDFREIILPFVKKRLLEINYENLGKSDAEEFARDFNEILDWAIKALEPTTKNDLGVDCVARQDVERFIEGFINEYTPEEELEFINLELDGLKHLPPATPQELKPMVEIDLYSVIKQKYIEREILDKIRAEIETKYGQCDICEYFEDYDYEENDISEYRPIGNIADILQIIDKYKAEVEPQESEVEE